MRQLEYTDTLEDDYYTTEKLLNLTIPSSSELAKFNCPNLQTLIIKSFNANDCSNNTIKNLSEIKIENDITLGASISNFTTFNNLDKLERITMPYGLYNKLNEANSDNFILTPYPITVELTGEGELDSLTGNLFTNNSTILFNGTSKKYGSSIQYTNIVDNDELGKYTQEQLQSPPFRDLLNKEGS